jgi:hypothetical protein
VLAVAAVQWLLLLAVPGQLHLILLENASRAIEGRPSGQG